MAKDTLKSYPKQIPQNSLLFRIESCASFVASEICLKKLGMSSIIKFECAINTFGIFFA